MTDWMSRKGHATVRRRLMARVGKSDGKRCIASVTAHVSTTMPFSIGRHTLFIYGCDLKITPFDRIRKFYRHRFRLTHFIR